MAICWKRYLPLSILLLVSLACSLLPRAAHPPVIEMDATPLPDDFGLVDIPGTTITYYEIDGDSEDVLRDQLNHLAPVGLDGYPGDAVTNWYIRWNWPGYGTADCDLSQATASYEIEVVFPRWTPPQDASPELVAKWNAYVHALAEHEQGHVDYVVVHYLDVLEAIQGAGCLTADGAAQAALEPIRQHDRDYDAETDHGATQGARFP